MDSSREAVERALALHICARLRMMWNQLCHTSFLGLGDRARRPCPARGHIGARLQLRTCDWHDGCHCCSASRIRQRRRRPWGSLPLAAALCRHWTLPMERWVPVGWNRVKANNSAGGLAGLLNMVPTVWGV
jgi:hypothetical protein